MRIANPRHRRMLSVVAVGAAAALTLSGCGSKSTESAKEGSSTESGAATSLSIVEKLQVDAEGAEVPTASAAAAADPAGDGTAKCDPATIAMAGALTGEDAALGINIVNGVKLALKKHNDANKDCQVTLKEFDTEGNPQKATQVVPDIISKPEILGVIGPAFSGETKATGQLFSDANLLALTASATNATLTQNNWKTFFRGLANDDVQGPAVANYLTKTAGKQKVCVVTDNTDYGKGLSASVTKTLGAAADASCAAEIKKGDKDFAATVSKVKAASPDAVFFTGYYAEAAALAQQLKDGGVEATFVSGDGANDPQFVKQAGSSAEGAVLSCPCGPAPAELKKEYEELSGQAPGVYSVEAYDLTTIVLKAIDSGVKTRDGLVDYVRKYDGDGQARHYKWNENGELASALIWVYEVK